MNPSIYGPDEASGIWVYLEHEDGELAGVSLELLGKGRELANEQGSRLTGFLLGDGVRPLADQAIAAGADSVLLAEHPLLEPYTNDAHTLIAGRMILDGKPDILLLGATYNGRDLAGRLAVRLRTGLTADCTDLTLDSETGLLLVGEVAGFGGGIVATIKCRENRPQMATVRPGVFAGLDSDPGRPGEVTQVTADISPEDVRIRVIERHTADVTDITQAPVIVAAGAGTRGDFALLKELAELLGGELGVTRVAVDNGWATADRQIGQTGYVTRPRLAIIAGISGALQFTVGIDQADTVLAIDLDPDAPIFEAADYGVVGDLFQVLPPLLEEIRAAAASNGAPA